jgi:hypothetical protein
MARQASGTAEQGAAQELKRERLEYGNLGLRDATPFRVA